MYTRVDEVGWQQSNAFKKAFSVDVPIEFVGVWYVLNPSCRCFVWLTHCCRDTVNSVGLVPRRLPFTTSNTIVRTFRHAVSLDERRAKFKANLWNRPNTVEVKLGITGQKPAVTVEHRTTNGPVKHSEPTLRAMEKKYSGQAESPTNIEEVRIHVHHLCIYRALRTFTDN
jgi:hypothetical protein